MHDARILYVEADNEARARVTGSLTKLGYGVRCVSDGRTALEELESRPADLVLLGLQLVGMEPVEVCRRVKLIAGDAFLPVVYLTTESDVAEKIRVLDAGGDDFCVEPMRVAELDARIRVLLRQRAHSDRFRVIAFVDPLTELPNRRAFDRAVVHAWEKVVPGRTLALFMIDIDFFKRVNDVHGHAVGDETLRRVARTIAGAVRRGDEVFRIGGEEFVTLAADVDPQGALAIGERIRRAVAEAGAHARRDGTPSVSVTVSIGIGGTPDPAVRAPEELQAAADVALYEAKATGRDRVVLHWQQDRKGAALA